MRASPLITQGIPEAFREDAAKLYWLAFSGKLGRLLGTGERAIPFLADILDLDKAVCVVMDDRLVGVAGFDIGDGGLVQGQFADMKRHYGLLGSLWRAPLLSILERASPEDYLQMDGIAVHPDYRGYGIGSALLEAILMKANDAGVKTVSLDVIDNNPRARALYERFGFEAVSSENLGIMSFLFGFRSSTKMFHVMD